MFNVLLDDYPNEYNGYKIATDFSVGIQISQCLRDEELTEQEKYATALNLLYIDVPDDLNEAFDGLQWFMTEYNHDNHKSGISDVQTMDFDIDQWRIYSAFLHQYGIDLNTAEMHWFAFMGLLTTLEECAFTRVIDIRTKKIEPKMDSKQKKSIMEAKRTYSISKKVEEPMTDAQIQAQEEFLKLIKKRK